MTETPSSKFWYAAAYPIAFAMLVLWAIVTFALGGPGWIHALLSIGVFILIWRVTASGTESAWRKYVSQRGQRK